MKLLIDENLSHRLVDRLADLDPGSQHVRQIGMKSAPDRIVLGYAELMECCIDVSRSASPTAYDVGLVVG